MRRPRHGLAPRAPYRVSDRPADRRRNRRHGCAEIPISRMKPTNISDPAIRKRPMESPADPSRPAARTMARRLPLQPLPAALRTLSAPGRLHHLERRRPGRALERAGSAPEGRTDLSGASRRLVDRAQHAALAITARHPRRPAKVRGSGPDSADPAIQAIRPPLRPVLPRVLLPHPLDAPAHPSGRTCAPARRAERSRKTAFSPQAPPHDAGTPSDDEKRRSTPRKKGVLRRSFPDRSAGLRRTAPI